MKALLLDGSRKGEEDLKDIKEMFEKELAASGFEIRSHELRNMDISPCTGCFGCWTKTPGICKIDDVARNVTKDFVRSDLLVLLTPVTFGEYSSELKKALDRSLGIILPHFKKIEGKTHHKKRYDRYPRLIVVGTLSKSNKEQEEIFRELVSRNALNAHSPRYFADVFIKGESKEAIGKRVKGMHKKVEGAV